MEKTMQQNGIERLDKNFLVSGYGGDADWYEASELFAYGQGWKGEADAWCRLPGRAKERVREPVWDLSRYSSGIHLEFETNSEVILAHWILRSDALQLNHMPATGVSGLDLYSEENGEWRYVGTGIPRAAGENEAKIGGTFPREWRKYRLYLPLYNGVSTLQIGVAAGAGFRPALQHDGRKEVCFYGTSITQGGCASRAGMSYPSLLERRLGFSAINLGFSGNGQAEPEMAQLLGELNPAAFVIDCLPNLPSFPVEEMISRLLFLLKHIRAKHSETPVLVVGTITYPGIWLDIDRREKWRCLDQAFRAVREQLEKAFPVPVLFHSGEELLGDDSLATVDGVHPTDLGFQRMAENLAEPLSLLLK